MTRTADPPEIVESLFPCDGPHSTQRTLDATAAIAHLVRYLNHATYSPRSVEYPSALYTAIGRLNSAAHGLKQLTGQLAQHAERFGALPNLASDNDQDPVLYALEVAEALRESRGPLGQVTRALERAHGPASHLKFG